MWGAWPNLQRMPPPQHPMTTGGEGCSNHKKRNLIYKVSYNKWVRNCVIPTSILGGSVANKLAWATAWGVKGVAAGNNSKEGGTDHPDILLRMDKTGFD
jgi:hypothetical protein